jgi:hypothetical protein
MTKSDIGRWKINNLFFQQGGKISKRDNTNVRNNYREPIPDIILKKREEYKKAFSDPNTVIAIPDHSSSFPGDSIRIFPYETSGLGTLYMRDLGNSIGVSDEITERLPQLYNVGRVYQDPTYRIANPRYFSKEYREGGLIPKSLIEVEGPELEVDEKTGKILKDFKGVPSHKNGGYTYMADQGKVIIRGKDADKYKSSDNFARKSMIREHIMTQKIMRI